MTSQLGLTTDSSTWDVADTREDAATTCSTSNSSRILSPRANEPESVQRTTKAVGKQTKQQDPSAQFVNSLSIKIEELDSLVRSTNAAERESGKLRKKQLREVQKFVADRGNSVEERVTFVQNKFSTQVSELLRVERQLFEVQKDSESVGKEKDKVQSDLRKTNLLKDKLEDLCRSLQKESREVGDESRRRNEEELRQRQALQAKFTQAINDVTVKMDQQQAERAKQVTENESLREKLNTFLEQFESFNQLVHKKDLELQLANARFDQQTALASKLSLQVELLEDTNKQISAAHEAAMTDTSMHSALMAKNAALAASNTELKEQLDHYCAKFSEFQSTVLRSNEVFDKLKGELEGHHKARLTLQRERDEMRGKAEKSDLTIVQLLEDRIATKKQMEKLNSKAAAATAEGAELRRVKAQKERLESLCRTLQAQIKAGGSAAATAAATPGGEGNSSNDGLSQTRFTTDGGPSSEAQSQADETPDQQSMRRLLGHLLGTSSTESLGSSSSSAAMVSEASGQPQAGLLVSDFLWPQRQQQLQQQEISDPDDSVVADTEGAAARSSSATESGSGVEAACSGGLSDVQAEGGAGSAEQGSGTGSRPDPSCVPAFVLPDTLD